MRRSSFSKIVAVSALLALSACATAPSHINDVCAVFDQNDGWFDNWQSAAERTEQKYGVPVPVLMATVRKESGFKSNARPPRTRLLGFIPWKHVSSATGFSQALDGTWSQYQRETGNWGRNLLESPSFGGRGGRASPTRSISSVGIIQKPPTPSASPATTPTISIWPIISAGPPTVAAIAATRAYRAMRAPPTRWPAIIRRSYGNVETSTFRV